MKCEALGHPVRKIISWFTRMLKHFWSKQKFFHFLEVILVKGYS